MEETSFQYQTQQNNNNGLKKTIVVGMVFLLATIIGILIIRQPKKENVNKNIVVEKKELSTPSPTEKPKKEKASVTIQVLNGSGITGQAGLVVKALQEAGYSPDNIKSGNADSTDNANTTISSRTDFEEIVINIKDVLKPMFPEIRDEILNLNSNKDSGFDVTIITGGNSSISTNNPNPSVTPVVPSSTPNPIVSPTTNPSTKP